MKRSRFARGDQPLVVPLLGPLFDDVVECEELLNRGYPVRSSRSGACHLCLQRRLCVLAEGANSSVASAQRLADEQHRDNQACSAVGRGVQAKPPGKHRIRAESNPILELLRVRTPNRGRMLGIRRNTILFGQRLAADAGLRSAFGIGSPIRKGRKISKSRTRTCAWSVRATAGCSTASWTSSTHFRKRTPSNPSDR